MTSALADDDLLQFFLHQLPMLAELLQDVAQAAGLRGQSRSFSLECPDFCSAEALRKGA